MLSQRRYFLIPVVVFLSTNLISASFLGIADEYSAFAFGPVTMENSDAGGRIAGMGNVTLNSYGMGKYATPSQYSLVSYGSVKCTNGSVSNGGIYSGNNTELYSAVVHGDIATKNNLLQQTGGTYDGSFITGGTATVEAYLNTKVINRDPGTCPVNFPAEEQRLVSQSRTLAASHINGTIQKDGYGSIIFNGSADVNFFSINSNDLLSAHTLDFRLPLNAIAIVNIAGVTVTFASKSIYCNAPEDILFNFSECLTLDVNSIGIRGSILAPGANVSFNYGYIDGT